MNQELPDARCLMVQGTGSHTGKSVMVAALCRILAQDGHRVVPFKAQNMSLNSFVTIEGGEMGRAQVLQAQAAGIEPHTDMNPILLKPSSDQKAQVILNGRPLKNMDAWEYHDCKLEFLPEVRRALEELRSAYEIVVIEGAGSPAEINLKDKDITNMRMAEAADAPVLLVGDIDSGGVFASLVGTLELLDGSERERVAGFIINKFRGSLDLLDDGLEFLTEKTGIPVMGVVPYVRDLGLEEEDSVSLRELRHCSKGQEEIDIAVIHLPHISNFTDFDPLARGSGVCLRYVSKPDEVGTPDALIIPGSKSTMDDLGYLRHTGMDEIILGLADKGVPVIGICGGYQMLGKEISDPQGHESQQGKVTGLGLLSVMTVIKETKSTHRVKASVNRPIPLLGLDINSPQLEGYEIHMGESSLEDEPVLSIISRSGRQVAVADGAFNARLNVFGSYIHGLFENRAVRQGFLDFLRARKGLPKRPVESDWAAWREDRLDRLAQVVRSSLDMRAIYSLLGIG